MHEEKQYLTLEESAALLGIAVITFRKLVRNKVIEPDIRLGMNYGFLREKLMKFNPAEHVTLAQKSYPKSLKRILKRPTQEELDLLEKDIRGEIDRTKLSQEKGIARHRLIGKLHSIAYRKLYFEMNK